MTDAPPIKQTSRRDLAKQRDAIQLIEQRACDRCGKRFMPRTGSDGSAQRFCSAACRLSFHTERLRAQRTSLYVGQLPQPATQAALSLTQLEQAERLIAKLSRLLASPVEGEVVGAARALDWILANAGGFHHLAEFVEAHWRPPIVIQRQPKPPPEPKHDWQILAARLLHYPEVLIVSARIDEVNFLNNMRRSRGAPSEKQWKWLSDIEARLPPVRRRAS
jgi:hypothetical protein